MVPRWRSTDHELHIVFGVDGYGLITVGENSDVRDGPFEGPAIGKSGELE